MNSTKLVFLVGLGGSAMLLASCSSISESDCQAGNWADIGYKDGLRGKARSTISDYVKTCTQYGAAVDRQSYLASYETGLSYYCTYDKGFELGELGRSYNTVCDGPSDIKRAVNFRIGYQDGARNYCTYDRGFNRGANGNSYKAMCEGPGMEAYRHGYDEGYARYEYEREYDTLNERVRRAKENVDAMKVRLEDSTLDKDERLRLEKKLRRFKDRLKKARWELKNFKRKYDLGH